MVSVTKLAKKVLLFKLDLMITSKIQVTLLPSSRVWIIHGKEIRRERKRKKEKKREKQIEPNEP